MEVGRLVDTAVAGIARYLWIRTYEYGHSGRARTTRWSPRRLATIESWAGPPRGNKAGTASVAGIAPAVICTTSVDLSFPSSWQLFRGSVFVYEWSTSAVFTSEKSCVQPGGGARVRRMAMPSAALSVETGVTAIGSD